MKNEEVNYFKSIINSITYGNNVFTVWYSDEKVLMGAILKDEPLIQRFFNYATIYNTIKDVDTKIKFSLNKTIHLADDLDFETWQPLQSPSEEEFQATYYMENAVFRIESLWDLLAQLFNLKENINKPFDKIYAEQLFHDAQQGKKAKAFAKKVYAYMQQQDDLNVEPWEGNYDYVKNFRNKMTHRISPNITSFSSYGMELRMPVILTLKRVIEDYNQVSQFIHEILDDILKDYEFLNNVKLYAEEENNV